MRASFRSLAVGLAVLLVPAAALSQQVRDSMREILDAVTTLLPVAADEGAFRDPARSDEIVAALETLADDAARLRGHGGDRGFDFLRDTLAADAEEALAAYRRAEYPVARFVIRHVIENCFACHTRLPGQPAVELGRRLAAAVDLERLDPAERVRVLVAMRRFEAAMEVAEQIFGSPETNPVELGLTGILEDYLKITLRVRMGLGRATDTLRQLLRRKDLPLYLELQVTDWLMALEELRGWKPGPDLLEAGRGLLEEARRRNLYLQDRRGLIHSLLASAVLHRHARSVPEGDESLAETYYLLGVAEASISRTTWVSETEFFLETAIRLDPDAPFAKRAYAFLERDVLASYSDSGGGHVPTDTWKRLIELRNLIERD